MVALRSGKRRIRERVERCGANALTGYECERKAVGVCKARHCTTFEGIGRLEGAAVLQ